MSIYFLKVAPRNRVFLASHKAEGIILNLISCVPTFTIYSSKLRGHRSRTSSFHSVMRFGAMYDCMNRKTSIVTLTRSKTTILKRKGGYSYLETADGICIFFRSQDSSPAHGRLLCYIILSRNLPGLRLSMENIMD